MSRDERLGDSLLIARNTLMIGVMVVVWALVFMVVFDAFPSPIQKFSRVLMPWKGLYMIPEGVTLEWRLAYMDKMLQASVNIAHVALLIVTASFAALVVYFMFVYQQRQRRMRENRMLVLKNLEIARRNEFIRYISATIGHEFKNNLGRIKRRLELIDVPQESRAQINSNFHKLFADIDIFKKISDERESVLEGFEKVNPKQILRELAGHYPDMAEFHFETAGVAQPIFASAQLLKSVFEILIDNAIKYKKPEQPKAVIRVFCRIDEDNRRKYVSLVLRDEGIGMDEQQADRCFYTGTSGSGAEGWGQGLYFAKYVVGLHAGRIRVGKDYTAPGRGAEFIINLPYVEESLDV